MKARIKWVENVLFVGESESGHGITLDGSPDIGGRNLGIRPMEAVLLGLGGCTAIDVVRILSKARQRIDDCVIEIEAERADRVPAVFSRIHLKYRLFGTDLAEHHVRRAVQLSAEKYCSVSEMLRPSVELSHDYEIVDRTETTGE